MAKLQPSLEFCCKVAEQITGLEYDLICETLEIHTMLGGQPVAGDVSSANAHRLQVAGFDPASIIAMITAIMQIIDMLKNRCNKPSEFAKNARVRDFAKRVIFRSRVRMASRDVKYEGDPEKLADAMLDVAHSAGSQFIQEVVDDFSMI